MKRPHGPRRGRRSAARPRRAAPLEESTTAGAVWFCARESVGSSEFRCFRRRGCGCPKRALWKEAPGRCVKLARPISEVGCGEVWEPFGTGHQLGRAALLGLSRTAREGALPNWRLGVGDHT